MGQTRSRLCMHCAPVAPLSIHDAVCLLHMLLLSPIIRLQVRLRTVGQSGCLLFRVGFGRIDRIVLKLLGIPNPCCLLLGPNVSRGLCQLHRTLLPESGTTRLPLPGSDQVPSYHKRVRQL